MLYWIQPKARRFLYRLYWLIFCQALFLSTLPVLSVQAAGANLSGAVEQLTLPNGLKVLLLEDHSFPVVSCLVWYRVGARNETLGATGLSHLVEHLLFKNVGDFSNEQLGATIACNGGQFNGYTSDDFTSFFETLPSSKLDLALKIESQRMHQANFQAQDIKEEISRIEAEFDREGKDPLAILSREVRAAAYQQHPYHNPTMGWRPDVEKLTLAQVRSFYQQYYRPDNATLVLVGDFQGPEAVLSIEEYFGSLPRAKQPLPEVRSSEPVQKGERRVVVRYGGKQEVLQVSYHAPAIDDGDAPAMAVIEKLLNAAYTGRLKSRLVDPKVCTSASCVLETKRDPGLFSVIGYAGAGMGQQKVLEAIEGMLGQLKMQPLPDLELRRAKNQCLFTYLSESDGPYHVGFHLGFFNTMADWKAAFQWPERIRSVTAADVQQVARKYFRMDNAVVGWLTSPNVSKPPPPADDQTKPLPRLKQAAEHFPQVGYKLDDQTVVPAGTGLQPGLPEPPPVSQKTNRQASQPAPVAPMSECQRVQQRVLKNGLRLVVFESRLSPVVQVTGMIPAGDVFDPAGKEGLSALSTAVLNSGSAKHSRSQMQLMQEDMGLSPDAMLKFQGGAEAITFSTRCLAVDLRPQLSLLAETLMIPDLSNDKSSDGGNAKTAPGHLDKAKVEAANTIGKVEGLLPARIHRALLQSLLSGDSAFYPDSPSDRIRHMAALQATDVKSFFRQYLVPDGTTIIIVGDIAVDQAVELVEQQLLSWTGKPAPKEPVMRPASKPVARTFIPVRDRSKATVCLGQLLQLTCGQPDFGCLLLTDCIVSSHPVLSRLSRRLLNDLPLAALDNSGLSTTQESLSNATIWSLNISLDADLVVPVVQSLLSEMEKLSQSGISAEELNEARRYLLGAIPVRHLSSVPAVSTSILDAVIQGSDPDWNGLLLSMRSISRENVNQFIGDIFKPDQCSLVLAGNAEAIKAIPK